MQPETALKLCAAVEILIVAVSVLLAVWKRNNLKSVIRTLGACNCFSEEFLYR